MAQVVAWPGPDGPGYVNLHWTSPKGPGVRGKPFKEVHPLMDMAQYATTKPGTYKEIYFCLSTQSATGKLVHGNATACRLKQNAIRLKSIWLDVDVKPGDPKHYGTLIEALDAIDAFVTAAKLPPPSALVLSGGGVHVYWISDIALTPAEWRPYAEGLKAEAIRLGLKCDAGLTTDEARVLRVPGTFNNKSMPPRPVRLAHLGANYDFTAVLPALAALVPAVASPVTGPVTTGARAALPFDLTKFPPNGMAAAFHQAGLNPQFDSLATGIGLHSDLPLKLDEVVQRCEHFQEAAATQGRNHSEPLWNLTLLASTWFEDGRDIAHYFSKGYPTYSRAETDAKYDDKLTRRANGTGWPSCQAFESAGAKCKTCPFYGKLRSPLNLAERAQLPFVVAQPAAPPPDDLMLPEGYTVNTEAGPTQGCICKIVQKTLGNGVTTEELAPLFYSKLKDPIAQRGVRKFMFQTSLDGGTWGPVALYETDLATEQSLVKALRLCGVKPYPDNQRGLVQFMTSWMAKYDDAKRRINTIAFGWLYDDKGGDMPLGFAYGGEVTMADGTKQAAGYADAEIEKSFKPLGSGIPWMEALRMVTEQHHPALEAIIAVSFAAPLLRSTGLYNGVFCAHSPAAGVGKSTSIAIGAAVWGSPVLTKERPLSSQKGIIRKMGHIKNLPVYWDEISEDEKMDEIRTILGYLTEGGGPTVLHQDRTLYIKDVWQTLMLVGSNKSLCENIMRNVQGTDAKLQRVFEFEVEMRPATRQQLDVTRLIASLDYNYGQMGLHYSEMLGRDPAGIDAYVKGICAKFNAEVGHKKQERFRAGMAACVYAGAELANQLGCDFNLTELWDFLKAQYLAQRDVIEASASVGGTAVNTLSMLSAFFKEYTRNALGITSMPVRKKGHPVAISYVFGPTKDRPDKIHIRCCQSDRFIEISKKELEHFLFRAKAAPRAVVDSMKMHFGACEEKKIDLSAGAGVIGGQETILRLPVPPGSPFESVLYTNSPIDIRPLSTEDDPPIVTGTVTVPLPSGAPMLAPAPAPTSTIASAMKQAAKDFKTGMS
jgi:hypothetical protein